MWDRDLQRRDGDECFGLAIAAFELSGLPGTSGFLLLLVSPQLLSTAMISGLANVSQVQKAKDHTSRIVPTPEDKVPKIFYRT